MKTSRNPSFNLELEFWSKNLTVFGIDEVGRGSFVGPLVGAAVSFQSDLKKKWLKDLNDSKVLSAKKREMLSQQIRKHSVYFIESVEIGTINKIGIGKSNSLLFKRLIIRVSKKHKNCQFIIDGRKILRNKNTKFIIKGDNSSISIAAASIVAKVYRDKLMKDLSKQYKGYNFSKNKGYGTKFHREALRKYGLSKIHRKSFNLKKYIARPAGVEPAT